EKKKIFSPLTSASPRLCESILSCSCSYLGELGVLGKRSSCLPRRSNRLTSQIVSDDKTTPGIISERSNSAPSPCRHNITVTPPTIIPASAPLGVMPGQYRASTIASPDAG